MRQERLSPDFQPRIRKSVTHKYDFSLSPREAFSAALNAVAQDPAIDTARLIIDALRPSDADAFFAYRSDPAVAQYQGWCPVSAQDATDFIAVQAALSFPSAGHWCQRAIRLREGALIGDLGLSFPEDAAGAVEFGLSLAPAQQGHGYAREAMTQMLDLIFGLLRYRRVVASVDPRNLRSVALLRGLGLRQEAHHRESLCVRGEWVDDVIFALLASEWSRVERC